MLDTNLCIRVLKLRPSPLRERFNAEADPAAAHAAEIRATLESKGMPIGGYDTLIAGHARSRGLSVVTNNLREFSRVDGLRAEDWLD